MLQTLHKDMVNKQIYMIAYDIVSSKRRHKVAKLLEGYGVRMNKSVFECIVSPLLYRKIMAEIHRLTDNKADSILAYPICRSCYEKSERSLSLNIMPVVLVV